MNKNIIRVLCAVVITISYCAEQLPEPKSPQKITIAITAPQIKENHKAAQVKGSHECSEQIKQTITNNQMPPINNYEGWLEEFD